MNETDDFTYVQRRLCAVMAKSEWTSSRMRMQKSGDELRERRAKSHQTANKFLQELLDKRTDSDLIDDNGAVDRYNKFVKYKSALNDDTNSTLDEFDRRLRALNSNRRNQTNTLNNENINIIEQKQRQQFINDLQPTIEIENDKKGVNIQQINHEERAKSSRILPSLATIPTTSTPNDTSNESITHEFHDDEIQELSNVQSVNISFIDSQANHIDSPIHENNSSLLEKTETINSSTSSLNDSLTQIIYAPKARRPDGTEVVCSSPNSPLPYASSSISLLNHIHFPRSLTSSEKLKTRATSKRQLPFLPCLQSSDDNEIQHEQFDTNQLYDLLDHLEKDSNQDSQIDFTEKLDQLTLSNVIYHHQEPIQTDFSTENQSLINHNDQDYILPNLFNQSPSSTQEKLFYTTLTIPVDDPKNIFLYTMTASTVQISASILVPYSILGGRRPVLKCSKQTHFKQIRSKQQKHICQVTAIESSLNLKDLQQNDIILKINDRSVCGVTTDEIIDILKQYYKKSNNFSLTIARLCQPFL
ncbi:unnamed protein product [Rotaria socialis]|uniref:PDZ domain-containing protein n=1 Tax=Rotaria socialis TaxID=392032 RepID=A0A817TLV1_9BILA|nr:unnamed protein product [Rotaria socialis]CAF3322679.1 unnamed protein product [Rotaria socialis]CAF3323273.1 unnamed protein product [Rotaria socialis]